MYQNKAPSSPTNVFRLVSSLCALNEHPIQTSPRRISDRLLVAAVVVAAVIDVMIQMPE